MLDKDYDVDQYLDIISIDYTYHCWIGTSFFFWKLENNAFCCPNHKYISITSLTKIWRIMAVKMLWETESPGPWGADSWNINHLKPSPLFSHLTTNCLQFISPGHTVWTLECSSLSKFWWKPYLNISLAFFYVRFNRTLYVWRTNSLQLLVSTQHVCIANSLWTCTEPTQDLSIENEQWSDMKCKRCQRTTYLLKWDT